MARLSGGVAAWSESGRSLQGPASGSGGGPPPDGLAGFLAQAGLNRLTPVLAQQGVAAPTTTLEGLAALHADGRPKLLSALQQSGVSKLPDRQALANAVGRAVREGRISTTMTSDAGAALNKQTPDSVWKATLSEFEYHVLREKGTEPRR
eukprot:5916218-Prymnesium_polylepis.1